MLLRILTDAVVLWTYLGLMIATEWLLETYPNADIEIAGVPLHTLLVYWKVGCLAAFLFVSGWRFFRTLIWG